MGLLSGLLGNASETDVAEVERDLERILADGESVERAFQLVRDLLIFTRSRFILVDKQGMTGKKTEYHSIPYRAITHFSIETAGHFDLESELKIWVSGTVEPFAKTFKRGDAIFEVQKALATYVGR
ncbi:MAG TPA: PH domain-containing protein [Thermoanaerobaculia bacterium]|nr:PH domain-containing protein [Thermoanaerobaculia bacterium]